MKKEKHLPSWLMVIMLIAIPVIVIISSQPKYKYVLATESIIFGNELVYSENSHSPGDTVWVFHGANQKTVGEWQKSIGHPAIVVTCRELPEQ